MSTLDGTDLARFAHDLHGQPVLRLALGLTLYFPRPMREHRAQVLRTWQRLLDWRGRDSFTWARLGGGNKTRKMNPAAYRTIESWLDGTRTYGLDCSIMAHGGAWETIGDHAFTVLGKDRPAQPGDTRVNFVDIRLPLGALSEAGPDALYSRICALAEPLDFLAGTAGLMLQASPFERDDLWSLMKALVVRYEGVEPDMAEQGRWFAAEGIPGVNWLTFVGAAHLERLGGLEAVTVAARQYDGLAVGAVGAGLVVRAGDHPRLGDRNIPSDDLRPYAGAFHLLEPALSADPDREFDEDEFDAGATAAWLRRFMLRT